MQKTARFWRFKVLTGVVALLCTVSVQAHDPRPLIAPIHTTPAGQTYGRWAAEWWQWALGVPAAANPLTDTTGEHCAQRQVDQVWFLAGSTSSAPVVRACEVPAGTSLFFPLIIEVSISNDIAATGEKAAQKQGRKSAAWLASAGRGGHWPATDRRCCVYLVAGCWRGGL
jgi:hypothetical protein